MKTPTTTLVASALLFGALLSIGTAQAGFADQAVCTVNQGDPNGDAQHEHTTNDCLLQAAGGNMTLEKQILGQRTGAWGN